MKNLWKSLTMICYGASISWLIAICIGGTTGIILGIVLLVFFVGTVLYEGPKSKEINCSLLQDLCLIATNFLLFIWPEIWPFTLALGLGGFSDIMDRITSKSYPTGDLKTFLKKEIRIDPFIELLVAGFTFWEMYEDKDYGNYLAWILIIVLLLDSARQYFGKQKQKGRPDNIIQ